MKTLFRAALLSTALAVAPAAADPLKDDLAAVGKEFCAGESVRECLADFRAEMASNQGYQEGALKVCPRMVVTDKQLRDLRNKKYHGSADFDRGYQHVVTRYADGDFLDRETVCNAATGDQPLHPKAYQKGWLKIVWTAADRQPLMSKEALAGKIPAFQNGYYNAHCQAPCKEVKEGGLADPAYAAGWAAGRIDFHRRAR